MAGTWEQKKYNQLCFLASHIVQEQTDTHIFSLKE
jgi:hypothetical protein